MCALEAQRQMLLKNSPSTPIRIFRNVSEDNKLTFSLVIDGATDELNISSINKICPQGVFEIVEEEETHEL